MQVASVKAVVEELTSQAFDASDKWPEKLFDLLLTNEYVFQSMQVPQKPKRLEEAAWATSQRVAMGRMAQGDQASAELLAYPVLGAAAQKGGESLLRPKVHFFLRGLDEMVVALTGTDNAPKADLFMSLSEGKEQHAGRHDDAFFPVLTCRSCGQHFLEKFYKELEFAKGPKNVLRGFEHGNATQDDNNHFRDQPTSTAPLGELLGEMKTDLANRLVVLFAQHWPQEAAELADRPAIEQIIGESATRLDEVVQRLHRRLT